MSLPVAAVKAQAVNDKNQVWSYVLSMAPVLLIKKAVDPGSNPPAPNVRFGSYQWNRDLAAALWDRPEADDIVDNLNWTKLHTL